jgi:hypothetical protein
MDEEKFIAFMKQVKKSSGTITGYVNSVKVYEDFLHTHRKISRLEEAKPEDLKAFVGWGRANNENVYRHLWGIRMYYEYQQLKSMEKTSREWMEYVQNETRKLREFPKVDLDSVKKLSAIGISTVNQLLRAGSTPEKQEGLSQESGAPRDAILEIFKLSQLSRLPGLKKVRGRLFFEAGLDTLTSIAALEAEDVQTLLQDYIDRTGFDGSAPTLSEAQVAVTMARFLPEELE